MDVATPTADCLLLIHDLLSPVIVKGNDLSHQEVSMVISECVDGCFVYIDAKFPKFTPVLNVQYSKDRGCEEGTFFVYVFLPKGF